MRDVHLHEVPRGRGRRLTPDRLHELVHLARAAGRDDQRREQPQLLGRERDEGAPLSDYLDRSEHAHLRLNHGGLFSSAACGP